MKKFLLLIVIALFTTSAFAQWGVPNKIKKAFAAQYPGSDSAEWTNDTERARSDVEWTVNYIYNGAKMIATYDNKANWLITLSHIGLDELPEAVVNTIKEEYQGCEFLMAAKMQEPGFDGYAAAVTYKKERWAMGVTTEGKIMRRRLTASGIDF